MLDVCDKPDIYCFQKRVSSFPLGFHPSPPAPQGFLSPTGSLWDLKDGITQSNHTILNTLSQAKNHNPREGGILSSSPQLSGVGCR